MSNFSIPYLDFVVLMGNYTPMGASFPLPRPDDNVKRFERYAAGIVASFLVSDAVTIIDDEMEMKIEGLMDLLNRSFDCCEVGDSSMMIRMGRNDADQSLRCEVSVPGGLPGSVITMAPLNEGGMFYQIISIIVGDRTALIGDLSIAFDTLDFARIRSSVKKSDDVIKKTLGGDVTMISCGGLEAFDVESASTMPPALLAFIDKLNRRSSRQIESTISKKLH
ncbi:hypothetical protein RYA05_00225 [Pseudomonas syringae pv. actinidiae]|nr:hypothetical protein [Pseudomonas syringae pv. actinidiae]